MCGDCGGDSYWSPGLDSDLVPSSKLALTPQLDFRAFPVCRSLKSPSLSRIYHTILCWKLSPLQVWFLEGRDVSSFHSILGA